MKLDGDLDYEAPDRDLENNNRPVKELRFTICNCFQIGDECFCQPPKKATLQPATLKSCFLERSKSEQIIRERETPNPKRAVSLSNINTAKYIRQSVQSPTTHRIYTIPPRRTRSRKSKFLRKISFLSPHKSSNNRSANKRPSKRKVHPKPPTVRRIPTLENIVEETKIEEEHHENCIKTEENKQWLGVNPDDHEHTNPASSSTETPHPQTPHIVFSPEPDDNPPEYPEDEDPEEQKDEEAEARETKNDDEEDGVAEPVVPESPQVDQTTVSDEERSPEPETSEPQRKLRKFKFPSDNSLPRGKISPTRSQSPIAYPLDKEDTIVNMEDGVQVDSIRPPHSVKNEISSESLIVCLSALYGKLLVVMGMAFPVAEIISEDVPLPFYYSFYLYLYCGSIIFLVYAYLFLLRVKAFPNMGLKSKLQTFKRSCSNLDVKVPEIPLKDTLKQLIPRRKEAENKNGGLAPAEKDDGVSISASAYKPPKYTITHSSNHGSMYLKMGAVVFGIGSMIYSGLAFGQYFELKTEAECANILMAITPATKMIFTFLQMYFIFLNSRVAISKHRNIARFGLMHMIGTNLCIWLNVLVQETKHEIAHLTHYARKKTQQAFEDLNHGLVLENLTEKTEGHHVISERSLGEMYDMSHCRRINLMGNVVTSASPFLFPCTIEYSLLCAGVLYVMWKNTNISRAERNSADGDSDISNFIARKVRHHYSVDCARASRGLFLGIFLLVLTIISLILFYVLITNEDFRDVAILEANVIEVTIYSLALISVIIGMKQMRELEFMPDGDIELDNILLLIAQAGVYIYSSFTIIGGFFSLEESPRLPLVTAILTLAQTTMQTIFILDGSRRCCYTADQHERKPGREMVTFLLVCNLAMWAISTFETSRADVHPVQLNFYGIWAWTIISHVSMPLAIFYRFHVTVCLGEIWKRSYKMKTDFMGL